MVIDNFQTLNNMNARENKCVQILTDLIENDGLIGIKTSF